MKYIYIVKIKSDRDNSIVARKEFGSHTKAEEFARKSLRQDCYATITRLNLAPVDNNFIKLDKA